MRQAEKEKKKICPEFRSQLTRARKFPKKQQKKFKKIKKPLSGIISSQYGDEIGREIGEKILEPNYVRTRPGQENYEKKQQKNS